MDASEPTGHHSKADVHMTSVWWSNENDIHYSFMRSWTIDYGSAALLAARGDDEKVLH